MVLWNTSYVLKNVLIALIALFFISVTFLMFKAFTDISEILLRLAPAGQPTRQHAADQTKFRESFFDY